MTGRANTVLDQDGPIGTWAPAGLKVVVTGPFDAGKTTLIETISEIEVVSTERAVSGWSREAADEHSGRTTVAMDYGRVSLDAGLALHLFGTPGQERFEFMWDILAEGMLGFVLVVDARRPETLGDARNQHDHFSAAADVPVVVAVNRLPVGADEAAALAAVRERLDVTADVPVLAVDVRLREDVKRVLLALLRAVLARLTAGAANPTASAVTR
ncbi:MAG TPA: ATP/GTP-binding protein [Egicoccus sp.]|nr:ATP/GTP-binding protein [Egicoccus sp.]HSK21863.1 ATP/GTP-binding protein [Egicoccus sp.]